MLLKQVPSIEWQDVVHSDDASTSIWRRPTQRVNMLTIRGIHTKRDTFIHVFLQGGHSLGNQETGKNILMKKEVREFHEKLSKSGKMK